MRYARLAGTALARAPLTIGFVAVMWGVAVASGAVTAGPRGELRRLVAVGVPALDGGRWWTPVTSGLWAHGPTAYVMATLLAVSLLPIAERRLGSLRATVVLAVAQVAGSLAGVGLVALGAVTAGPRGELRRLVAVGVPALDGEWATDLAHATEIGPIGAVLATVLGATASMDTLWRRRTRLLLVSLLLVMALYAGLLVDVTRLTIGLTGLLAGVLVRRGTRPASRAPSVPESRALVALFVVITAIGPVVAALAGTPIGPLSVLRHVIVPELPGAATVRGLCQLPHRGLECRELRTALRLSGWGPAMLAVVPAVLLVVVAEGLRRGRRAAWWAGLVVNTVLLGLGAVQAVTVLRTPDEMLVYTAGLPGGQSFLSVVLPLALPAVVIAVLLAAHRRFDVARPGARPVVLAAGGVFAGTAVCWLVGGWLAGDGFDRRPRFVDLLVELPQRYVPPGYLVETQPVLLPVHPVSTVLFEWTGVVFWLAATVLLLRLFTTQGPPAVRDDRDRVRALLCEDPRSDLGQLAAWPGHRYWFDVDGRTAIAYRVIGSVALTTGGPFGAPGTDAAAIAGFTRDCRDLGLVPCFYVITARTRADCVAAGYATVQVAEETVLPLAELAFTGRRWQDVRTARNRAAKAGVVAEWTTYADAPLGVLDQIRSISEEWIADKGLPEMGFTLGGLTELAEPGTRLLLAVDADRTVHGVTSWLPVYRDGRIVGWTLDFMRRRAGSGGFSGVMEFLIAEAAIGCQAEGAEFLSLSGAPLARVDRGERPSRLQRVLDLASVALEPVYGFSSLLAFKAKFQPEYRPLYMAYPETAALPAISRAITHAYLPTMSARQLARMTRRLAASRT